MKNHHKGGRVKRFAKILLMCSPLATATLAGLSVAGAFLGVDRAAELFRSIPMIVVWFVLTLSLLATEVAFESIRRSPLRLAAHIGPAVVLLGAMMGSSTGIELHNKLTRDNVAPTAFMLIPQGADTDVLLDYRYDRAGELPYSVRLNRFWIEHYPPRDPRWQLIAKTPSSQGEPGMLYTHELAWNVGETLTIPGTGARLKVLEYLKSARPVFGEGPPATIVMSRDVNVVTVPAVAGHEVILPGEPKVRVRVEKVFTHPPLASNPAESAPAMQREQRMSNTVRLVLEYPDGTQQPVYVMRRSPQTTTPEGVRVRYIPAQPVNVVADAQGETPAMKVEISRGGATGQLWLIPDVDASMSIVPLGSLFGDESLGDAALLLARPVGAVKAYKSDVSILSGDAVLARKVIEVNHPLYFGGYHFYQYSYDMAEENFSILLVKSNEGLAWVYAGFAILLTGLFGSMWFVPAWNHLRRGRVHGH